MVIILIFIILSSLLFLILVNRKVKEHFIFKKAKSFLKKQETQRDDEDETQIQRDDEDESDEDDEDEEDNADEIEDDVERNDDCDREKRDTIQFSSPLLIDNIRNNVVNFNNDVRFDKGTLFDKNNSSINFNDTIYLNSESSVYFDENDKSKVLQKKHVIPIKTAASKKNYVDKVSKNILKFKDGKLVSSYSGNTGGNDKCSTTIWNILMGRRIESKTLCKNCCAPDKNKGIVQISIIENSTTYDNVVIDLSKNQSFLLKGINNIKSGSTMLLYRTFESINCRVVLINTNNDRNLNVKMNSLREQAEINKLINNMKSLDVKNQQIYEINSKNNEWGNFENGYAMESKHIIKSARHLHYDWAYVEYIDD